MIPCSLSTTLHLADLLLLQSTEKLIRHIYSPFPGRCCLLCTRTVSWSVKFSTVFNFLRPPNSQVCPPNVLQTVNCESIFNGHVFRVFGGRNASSFRYFSVARNPWTRALSAWNYARLCYSVDWRKTQLAALHQEHPAFPSLQSALAGPGYASLPAPFLKWFETAHFGPQAPFLTDVSGVPAVDMVLRTEFLQSDVLCLFKLLGIAPSMTNIGNIRHFKIDRCKYLDVTPAIVSYYSADFMLLSGIGGYGQLRCNQSTKALVLGSGCQCSRPEYCVCQQPEAVDLQCDQLACSTEYTSMPCHPKLCSQPGSTFSVPLAHFSP